MNIAIASSWNIIGGYAGYISLGHNVFFAIGGYAAAILFAYFGVSPFIAFPLCRADRDGGRLRRRLITLRTPRADLHHLHHRAGAADQDPARQLGLYRRHQRHQPAAPRPAGRSGQAALLLSDARCSRSARPTCPSGSAARSSASACAPSRRTRPRRKSPASRRASTRSSPSRSPASSSAWPARSGAIT